MEQKLLLMGAASEELELCYVDEKIKLNLMRGKLQRSKIRQN